MYRGASLRGCIRLSSRSHRLLGRQSSACDWSQSMASWYVVHVASRATLRYSTINEASHRDRDDDSLVASWVDTITAAERALVRDLCNAQSLDLEAHAAMYLSITTITTRRTHLYSPLVWLMHCIELSFYQSITISWSIHSSRSSWLSSPSSRSSSSSCSSLISSSLFSLSISSISPSSSS